MGGANTGLRTLQISGCLLGELILVFRSRDAGVIVGPGRGGGRKVGKRGIGGEPLALEACSRSPSLWEGGGELGKMGGEKGGTSKGEIEDRAASSPSLGLVSLEVGLGLLPSQEVGLLPTSSGCGLDLLPVLWEVGVYRTVLFSLSSLPELKSMDSSWEDSTSGLAAVWSSPSVWSWAKMLFALVLLVTGKSRTGTVRLRSCLNIIKGCRLACYFFVVGCQNCDANVSLQCAASSGQIQERKSNSYLCMHS